MQSILGAGSHKLRSKAVFAAALAAAAVLMVAAPDAMAQATGVTGGTGSSVAIPTTGQSIGGLSGNFISSIRGAANVATAICYLFAFISMLGFVFKLKEHGKQPDRTPMREPVILFIAMALFAGMPEVMGTGVITLLGSGAHVVAAP